MFVSTAFRVWKFWRFSRIFMLCCMNPEISPHYYLIKINGLLWLWQSTIKINLFSFDCFFVQWTNGHVYADVIPICRSINVLWIKTISISKVTKYCAALSNAKLNRKWRPLKCIFHNRIRMRFWAFFSFSTFFYFIQNAISGETFDFRILTSIWLVIKTITILETKRTLLGFILATPRDHSTYHTMQLFLSLPEQLSLQNHFEWLLNFF